VVRGTGRGGERVAWLCVRGVTGFESSQLCTALGYLEYGNGRSRGCIWGDGSQPRKGAKYLGFLGLRVRDDTAASLDLIGERTAGARNPDLGVLQIAWYREVIDGNPPASWPHRLRVCHTPGCFFEWVWGLIMPGQERGGRATTDW
jgi:hypothetical protein